MFGPVAGHVGCDDAACTHTSGQSGSDSARVAATDEVVQIGSPAAAIQDQVSSPRRFHGVKESSTLREWCGLCQLVLTGLRVDLLYGGKGHLEWSIDETDAASNRS